MWTVLPSARSKEIKEVKRHAKPKGSWELKANMYTSILRTLNRILEVEEIE